MKTYEELAVLEQGDDGAIVSIRGQDGPMVLLSAKYLEHLSRRLVVAERGLEGLGPSTSSAMVAPLCAEIRTLLEAHRDTCAKYDGGTSSVLRTLEGARREIEDLRRQLQKF